ncbi:putative zinc ribbon protein [Serratia oryzae]|uniref:Uncharacterized protein n=1 Tax=Serratia oryzae TaxID=2034155 RepID=A0A1S8CEK0_9GAMM|nr:putative zinc ribbon protein [Serratia oryzae]OMQ18123.1 hypothetical protein BMI79_22005 [Serratia oryzae]
MRMMKCYLANDSNGCFVTAKEVSSLEKRVRTCVSCHGLLVWHSGGPGEVPWFEHDQQSVSRETLMKCAYLDPQVKADERHAELRKAVGWLPVPIAVKSWYCVLCQSHYQGEKHCTQCGSGIYSIEEARWRENYT